MFEIRDYVIFLRNQGSKLDDKYKNPWKQYDVMPEDVQKMLSMIETLLVNVDKLQQANVYTRLDEISKW